MTELKYEIMRALEIDWQWIGDFNDEDVDGIAHARSQGRKAGRALGVKVLTFQHHRGPKVVRVTVAMNQKPPSEDDQQRQEDRFRLWTESGPSPRIT